MGSQLSLATRAVAARSARGFTLIEVMVVLIILGVLAAVLMPKMSNLGEKETSAAELLKARLRYAQMRAVNNVSVHGVHSTGSSYWLFYDGDTTKKELFPGEGSTTVTLPSGITMDTFTVSFDSRGVPYSDAAATAGNELTSSSAAASISVGGKTVRITPNTGYIPD